MNGMLRSTRIAVAAIALGMGLSVYAQGSNLPQWAPTDDELALLPDYCQARFTYKHRDPQWKQWMRRMGPDFLHIHHYCAGLNFVSRYYKTRDKNVKRYELREAYAGFDHGVTRFAKDFVLLPEAYLNRGLTIALMKRGDGISDMKKSIQLNPKLVKGYAALADAYIDKNEKQSALEVVTVGLRHNPDAPSLQRRYLELGGKPPYPEPIRPNTADVVQRTDGPTLPEAK